MGDVSRVIRTGAQRLYARHGFSIVDGSATYDRGQRALRMARRLVLD